MLAIMEHIDLNIPNSPTISPELFLILSVKVNHNEFSQNGIFHALKFMIELFFANYMYLVN